MIFYFKIYYIVSGLIMAVIAATEYENICKSNGMESDTVKYVGKKAFILINFLFGFINLPVILPFKIKSIILQRRLKKLKEENKMLTKMRDDLKDLISKNKEKLNNYDV